MLNVLILQWRCGILEVTQRLRRMRFWGAQVRCEIMGRPGTAGTYFYCLTINGSLEAAQAAYNYVYSWKVQNPRTPGQGPYDYHVHCRWWDV